MYGWVIAVLIFVCSVMKGFLFACAELENKLLSRFDAASQRRELSTMAECAKILSQVIRVSFVALLRRTCYNHCYSVK